MDHMTGVDSQEPMTEESVAQQAVSEELTSQPVEPKRHLIYDHKVLSCIVPFILYYGICIVLAVPLVLAGFDQLIVERGVSIVSAIIVLLLYKLRFRRSFDGVVKWSRVGLLLSLPILLFAAPNIMEMVKNIREGQSFNPLPLCLIMALAPGIAEEILFRAVPGANWLRVRRERRDVVTCVLVTSLVFALVHGSNALYGSPLSTTIFQICYAFCFGVACCAVFVRSGSTVPTMIVHTIVDLTAFLTLDLSHGGVMTDELVFDLSFYVTIVCSVAILLWGLYLIRPDQLDGIVDRWNKKWHTA